MMADYANCTLRELRTRLVDLLAEEQEIWNRRVVIPGRHPPWWAFWRRPMPGRVFLAGPDGYLSPEECQRLYDLREEAMLLESMIKAFPLTEASVAHDRAIQ